jgi:hypothetical protein
LSWDAGEFCEFSSALVAALECLGQEVSYDEVNAVCGAGFRMTHCSEPWFPGAYSIRNLEPDPWGPVRRAFRWVGRECAMVQRAPLRPCFRVPEAALSPDVEVGDHGTDRARILESLDRGVPVVAFNVVGPSDCCVIAGYDEGGDVLMGWSTYQDIPDDHKEPHDSTGYFRKTGWEDNLPGYMLLGESVQRPSWRMRTRSVLLDAVTLVRGGSDADWTRGLDAYEAWARDMENDGLFGPEYQDGPLGPYLGVAAGMVMIDDRRSAACFLRQVAVTEPCLAPQAEAAAACYDRTLETKREMDRLLPGNFSPDAMRDVFDPGVRRQYAQLLRQARTSDEQAIQHVDALTKERDDDWWTSEV